MLARLRRFAAPTVLVAASGCGASYESLYEGDVRFEHCYRIDLDGSVPADTRERCWDTWLRYFTHGQTRNRINYARNRSHSLLGGDTSPVQLQVMSSASTAPPVAPVAAGSVLLEKAPPIASAAIACAAPTNPFEPPPPVLVSTVAASSASALPLASASSSAPSLTLHQECVQGCGERFTHCATLCEQARCVSHCGDIVKVCIANCL